MSNKFLKSLFSEIETIPAVLQSSYYPSLDGLRGIAIIMVVFFHLHLSWNYFYAIIFNGTLGVLIFFVLSGFLITTLCIKEKVVTKDISLRNFYLRRSLRIFPVAYLYIFVLVILNVVFKFNINYMSILGAGLYLMNLSFFGKFNSESKTGHFWSLAVEEQFYLIFPFILKKNYRLYLVALLTIIFLLPLLMGLQYYCKGLNNEVLTKLANYLIKFQGIAVGCLFSILAFKYPFNVNVKLKVITNILAIVLILYIHYEGYLSPGALFTNLLISFLVGYVIITNIVPGNDFIFKSLNTKFIKMVGVLSYSIYIWQQIFTYYDARFPFFMKKFPFNIISLAIVSWLSYHFYERYFLRLKSKFSKIKKERTGPAGHHLNFLMKRGSITGFFADIKTIPPVLQGSYYPSLNGIRGIAIIMVVLSHLRLGTTPLYNTIFNGTRGVYIFFVLSGFLITTLCLKEKAVTRHLSLRNFYIRRALRIFPVAYLFIVVLIILNFFFQLGIHYKNFLGTSLYLMDFSSYFRKYYFSWYTGHFWSLSVEEQFYLIIPFILQRKFKVYLLVILAMIFLLPLILTLQYMVPALNTGVLYAFTHFTIKFQAIAVGCLFSVLMFKYPIGKWISGKTKIIFNIIAFALIVMIPYDDLYNLESVFTGLLISIVVGYLIVSNIIPGKDIIFRLLNTKLLNIIGILSYSIYIWQQIFTAGDKRLPAFMVTYPYDIICIIVVSCCSYYFYERPFLKLKARFSKVKAGKALVIEEAFEHDK